MPQIDPDKCSTFYDGTEWGGLVQLKLKPNRMTKSSTVVSFKTKTTGREISAAKRARPFNNATKNSGIPQRSIKAERRLHIKRFGTKAT
jgi:hypothetical protein